MDGGHGCPGVLLPELPHRQNRPSLRGAVIIEQDVSYRPELVTAYVTPRISFGLLRLLSFVAVTESRHDDTAMRQPRVVQASG